MQKTLTKPPQTAPITTNKHTKKIQYNDRFVTSELTSLLEECRTHEEIKSKAQLFRNRTYSGNQFSRWRNKYPTNMSIQDKLKKIEEILESRLVEQGLAGKAIPMTIFLLKNYYGYTDQYQQTVDTSVTFKVVRGIAPPQASPKIIDSTNTIKPAKH